MEIKQFRDNLSQFKGQYNNLLKTLETKEKSKLELSETLVELEECLFITQEVSKIAQDQLTNKLNDVVTTAIQTVFGDAWEFKMILEPKNNSIHAIPTFYKNGEEESPKVSQGGGLASVASLALRVALLTLKKDPTPIILLDESFGAIGAGDIDRTCELLKSLSTKLGIQFILVTHKEEIRGAADRLFRVTMNSKEESQVEIEDIVKERITMEEIDG